MYNTESVPENETQKVLWDSEKQRDYLISTRPPDLVIVIKKQKQKQKTKQKREPGE